MSLDFEESMERKIFIDTKEEIYEWNYDSFNNVGIRNLSVECDQDEKPRSV